MRWLILLALAASLARNAWLTFRLVNAGVTQTYLEGGIQENRMALLQCVAVTNAFLDSGARREELIAKAKAVSGIDSSLANDGHFWVGPFGMDFDKEGNLISVAEWYTVYEQISKKRQ